MAMGNEKKMQAYETIRDNIIRGIYPPASDLSEEMLIRELGISRTPIREALQKLNEEGFINIYPRKGTFVSDISLDMINWVYEIRRLNEPYITRHACGKLSLDWLLEMQRAIEKTRDAAEDSPELRRNYVEQDRMLHETILTTCSNEYLRSFMKNVYNHAHRFRIKTGFNFDNYKGAVIEHLEIIDALMDKDEDRVEALSLRHITNSAKINYHYAN